MTIRKFAATMIAALTIGATSISAVTPAFAATQVTNTAAVNSTYYVNVGSTLCLRPRPSTRCAVFGKLANGTQVEVKRFEKDWAFVYVPSIKKYGFVSKNYLNTSAPKAVKATTQTKKAAAPAKKTTPQAAKIIIPEALKTVYSGQALNVANLKSGSLAVRKACSFDDSNIRDYLNNGDKVVFQSWGENGYAYVYAPSLDMYGFVNASYIAIPSAAPAAPDQQPAGPAVNQTMTVCNLQSGALAVRNACSADDSNIQDYLNNGDKVQFQSRAENGYTYVFAPSLGIYGYVNSSYIA